MFRLAAVFAQVNNTNIATMFGLARCLTFFCLIITFLAFTIYLCFLGHAHSFTATRRIILTGRHHFWPNVNVCIFLNCIYKKMRTTLTNFFWHFSFIAARRRSLANSFEMHTHRRRTRNDKGGQLPPSAGECSKNSCALCECQTLR